VSSSEDKAPRLGRAGEILVRGRLFADATPGQSIDGEISISGRHVRFQAGDAITELPVLGLIARVSGFDDRTLFLSHPSHPGVEIATDDPHALHAPEIASLPSMSASLALKKAGRRRFWGCVLVLVLAAVASLIALSLGSGWLLMTFARIIDH
jgi:hypothetical protein